MNLVAAINKELREPDEFFGDDDELDRVERVLRGTEGIADPVRLAGALMSRLARAQAFAEGNKRTALAIAHLILSFNGVEPETYLPPEDAAIPNFLVRAARGEDVEHGVLKAMSGKIEVTL